MVKIEKITKSIPLKKEEKKVEKKIEKKSKSYKNLTK